MVPPGSYVEPGKNKNKEKLFFSVSFSRIQRRRDQKKTYQRTARVPVLGLVCGKMAERGLVARQEEDDRPARQATVTVAELVEEEKSRTKPEKSRTKMMRPMRALQT